MASAKPGDGAGDVGDGRGRHGGDDAGGADRDDDVAGPGGQAERGRRVVAGARPEHAPTHRRARRPARPVRRPGARPAGGRASPAPAGRGGTRRCGPTSRRCRWRRPRSVASEPRLAVGRQPPGQPVVGQADGGGAVGVRRLGVGQPAQLGRGEGGDRDHADGVGPRLPAGGLVAVAELGDQVGRGAGGADVVPEQRVADDGAVLVEADHAVLLPAHGQRGDVGETAGRRRGGGEGLLPGARGRPRCRAGAERGRTRTSSPVSASRTTTLQACVEVSTPATRVTRRSSEPRGRTSCGADCNQWQDRVRP